MLGVAIRRGHNLPDEYGKQAGIHKTRRRHLRAYLYHGRYPILRLATRGANDASHLTRMVLVLPHVSVYRGGYWLPDMGDVR
jgi:hypothetical protein